jgi:hypothetical protein
MQPVLAAVITDSGNNFSPIFIFPRGKVNQGQFETSKEEIHFLQWKNDLTINKNAFSGFL